MTSLEHGHIAPVILRTTLATLVAFIGGAFGVVLGRAAYNRLSLLVCIAAGSLLAVTLFDVLPDARVGLNLPAFLAAIASGYLLFWWVGEHVFHICPACAITAFDEEATHRLQQTALLLMIALGLHSTMDGLAVVIGDKIVGHAEAAILFALSLHKLPEGLALALLLIGAGYSRKRALLCTLAIQSTTELGGLVGVFVLKQASNLLLSLILAHVGGNLLYLVHSAMKSFSNQRPIRAARPLLIGSSVAFTVTASLIWVTRAYAR